MTREETIKNVKDNIRRHHAERGVIVDEKWLTEQAEELTNLFEPEAVCVNP